MHCGLTYRICKCTLASKNAQLFIKIYASWIVCVHEYDSIELRLLLSLSYQIENPVSNRENVQVI